MTVLSGSMVMCVTFSVGVGDRVRGSVTDLDGDEGTDVDCEAGETDRLRDGASGSGSGSGSDSGDDDSSGVIALILSNTLF